MNFKRPKNIFIPVKGNDQCPYSQFKGIGALLLLSWLTLTGCETIDQLSTDFAELGRGVAQLDSFKPELFKGGLAADEPHAALAGRDVLKAGGNAVDAATAIYFNLAVTMPSSAGLGGGGVCIVYDAQTNKTMVLEFLAKAQNGGNPSKRANAVPANLAGFHALHARYGRLPWSQLLAPAEGLARFGIRVSRAFSYDLNKIGEALLVESSARKIFSRQVLGGLLLEGDKWIQPNLANMLGSIRKSGAAALYRQPGADSFAAAVKSGGGSLSANDLLNFKPAWRNPIKVPLGDISVYFTPPPAAGGAIAAEMLAMMLYNQRFDESPLDVRPHLIIETAIRAYGDRSSWMRPDGQSSVEPSDLVLASRLAPLMSTYNPDSHVPVSTLNPASIDMREDPSATTFAVMDADGAGIACALTMNGLFGNGLIATGSGILMAAAPGSGGRGPISLGPMLAVDHFTNDFFFAGAASGGVAAPTSLISVAMSTAVNVEGLEKAMQAKRLHNSGNPDITYYEQGYDEAIIKSLISKGHRVAATPSLGRVNAVGCLQGLPSDPNSCEAITDPRGYGLGLKVDQ